MTAQERYDRVFEPDERDDRREPTGGTAELIHQAPAGGASEGTGKMAAGTHSADARAETEAPTPLLPAEDVERFRADWERVQVGFVDEPRRAVQQADQLVAGLMRELAEGFAKARSSLEPEWDRGEDVSTEDLRQAFVHYRSLFDELLETGPSDQERRATV